MKEGEGGYVEDDMERKRSKICGGGYEKEEKEGDMGRMI